MTLSQAIEQIDNLLHNTYPQEMKVKWLSQVDSSIKKNLFDTHENPPDVEFTGYDEGVSLDVVLLAPEPYSDLYIRWLEAQIHYYNEEYDNYNQALTMYNAVMRDYVNDYNRTHMHKGQKFTYF